MSVNKMSAWEYINVIPRRSRLLLATGLVIVVTLMILTKSDEPRRINRILKNGVLSNTYTFRGEAILEEPHLIDDADELLPHFKAVVQYPGMPIRDAKQGCNWIEDTINQQWAYDETRGEDLKWIIEDEDDFKIDLMRKQWQYFVANEMRPWVSYRHKFKGKGIVIPAGHPESVHRAKVILNMLNKLGSTLPVEIAYWSEEELSDRARDQLSAIRPGRIFFNDLASKDQPIPTYYARMNNFHLKIPAIINSRFAEIILMDSDNIPVIAPEELFESETYKEYGTIFWPDVARTRRNNPIWPITNTKCRTDEWEMESGQLLVDKRKYWYHLQLATWFEVEHKAYYETLILGDKDMFRFAWHALKTPFGVPSRWLTSVGTLSPGVEDMPGDRTQQIYCGHTFAQHHPEKDGRVAFLHGGLLKTIDAAAIQWQLDNAGGLFQAYKRTGEDQMKERSPRIQSSVDPAHYIPDKDEKFRIAWCLDLPGDASRPFEELVPNFQETFKEVGGYWMLEEEDLEEVHKQNQE